MSEQIYSVRTGYDNDVGRLYVGVIPPFEDLEALQGVGVNNSETTVVSVNTVETDNRPGYTQLVFNTINECNRETARLAG